MIRIRNIWKRYGSLEVLKGLDLDIETGETLVILGKSGVGKSVLLRLILGLEKPDRGEIFIDGTNVCETSSYKELIGLKMGMLFQGAALFDSMDVFENVAFYFRQHPGILDEKSLHERVLESLNLVGLESAEKKMPSELSGGMRKRVALARLVAYRPSILLLDEPTTGLDPITSMQINSLISETQSKLKATSIVVTHDIKSALEVGQRLAFHDEGKIRLVEKKELFIQTKDPVVSAFFENALISPEFLAKEETR